MKKRISQILLAVFISISLYAQEPKIMKYETFELFLTEQNEKASKIQLGHTEAEVRAIFGESIRVKVPKVGKMKPLDHVFKQPEFKNLFKPRTEEQVTVLWYFTTPRDQSGAISKRECTPILIVKDEVIGIGWDAFNKARKDGSLRK